VNPRAKPVTPKTTKGCERDLMRFLLIYQAAVEDDAEDNRYATRDHAIQPFGTDFAAEICGRSSNYMRNTLNPFNETNPAGLKEFFRLVWNGLDESVLQALLNPRRMAAIAMPEGDAAGMASKISDHMLSVTKEVGDVAAEFQAAMQPDSPRGSKISPREKARIKAEIMEAGAALIVVLEDLEDACR